MRTKLALLMILWALTEAGAAELDEVVRSDLSHWADRPVVRPEVPEVSRSHWVLNPVDAFIAAAHEQQGLTPVPPASREVLARRVYLDLIGLPPTPEELERFLTDDSPRAYEALVDRLLASPQYGERWGRHWLDIWRYSDWYGRRSENEIRYSQRHIWRWRDWVVESLNSDKGYDRMVLEMLAADELSPEDPDALRATGFLARNWYKFNRNTWLQDTVEHTSLALLGSTLKCARCHDHKFDPIAQEDYYRFRAFFEPHEVRTDPLPDQPDLTQDGLARVYDRDLTAATYLFERGDDRYPQTDRALEPGVPTSLGGPPLKIEPVKLPAVAYYPALRPEHVAQQLKASEEQTAAARAARSEALETLEKQQEQLERYRSQPTIESAPRTFLSDTFEELRSDTWEVVSGSWTAGNGMLQQTQVGHFATIRTLQNHPQDFRARVRYRTHAGGLYRSVGIFFDMVELQSAQAVYTSVGKQQQNVQAFHRENGVEVYPPAGIVPCSLAIDQEIVLEIEVRGKQLTIWLDGEKKLDYTLPTPRQPGRFALWNHSGTADFLEVTLEPLVPTVEEFERHVRSAQHLVAEAEKQVELAEAQHASLERRIEAERARHGLAAEGDVARLAREAARAHRHAAVVESELQLLKARHQLASIEASASPPSEAAEAARKKLAEAEAAVTQAQEQFAKTDSEADYPPLGEIYPAASSGRRLALARWIVDRENPRTARVAVNHIWLRHFGEPLVAPVTDFGQRASEPVHPQLLDWLAAELMDSGWSMKHLHRLIVTSNTYRLSSSAGSSAAVERRRDPANQWLWHMRSRRMEAEVVRDSLLHLAGELDLTLGGPDLDDSLGETVPRRSLYFRITPDNAMPLLKVFDMASPLACYERTESVVPQQGLALMNSRLALHCARQLGRQLAADHAGDEPFIVAAFQHVLIRPPSAHELAACQEFLAEQRELLRDPAGLQSFPAAATARTAPAVEPELRARENLIHVLLNHNEFVTIR